MEVDAELLNASRLVADMLDGKPLGLDEGDLALVARLRSALERSISVRELPREPPPGWDSDLWFQFRMGAIYEQEVPRDCDGEPLLDEDGNPRRRHA